MKGECAYTNSEIMSAQRNELNIETAADNQVLLDREFVEALHLALQKFEKVSADNVTFLPTYEIEYKAGKLSIDVVAITSMGKIINRSELYVFFVKDQNGRTIALRQASIYRPILSKKPWIVYDDIQIGQKGSGLAIPIDLALMDCLQRIANDKNVQLKWAVSNGNLENLKDKKFILKWNERLTDEEVSANPEIVALEEEQARWQKVWGEKGKLGLGGKPKFFSPTHNSSSNLNAIDKIVIKRVDDPKTGIASSEVVSETLTGDALSVLENRRVKLKDMIRRNKTQAK